MIAHQSKFFLKPSSTWSASPSGEMKNMIGWKVDICKVGKKSTSCPGEVTKVCLGRGIFLRFAHYGPNWVTNRQKNARFGLLENVTSVLGLFVLST